MSSFLDNVRLMFLDIYESNMDNTKMEQIQNYVLTSPLWVKLTVCSGIVSYVYIRYKWTALNDCGVDVIQPRVLSLGTMTQYFGTDTYFEWAKFKLWLVI